MRTEVARAMFGALFVDLSWEEHDKRLVTHARTLNLIWAGHPNWNIRLDQGFVYWVAEDRDRHKLNFPFDDGAQRQLM